MRDKGKLVKTGVSTCMPPCHTLGTWKLLDSALSLSLKPGQHINSESRQASQKEHTQLMGDKINFAKSSLYHPHQFHWDLEPAGSATTLSLKGLEAVLVAVSWQVCEIMRTLCSVDEAPPHNCSTGDNGKSRPNIVNRIE